MALSIHKNDNLCIESVESSKLTHPYNLSIENKCANLMSVVEFVFSECILLQASFQLRERKLIFGIFGDILDHFSVPNILDSSSRNCQFLNKQQSIELDCSADKNTYVCL